MEGWLPSSFERGKIKTEGNMKERNKMMLRIKVFLKHLKKKYKTKIKRTNEEYD